MSERHNFSLMLYTPIWFVSDKKPVAGEKKLTFNIQKTNKWKILMF